MTHLPQISHVVVSDYWLLTIWISPLSPAQLLSGQKYFVPFFNSTMYITLYPHAVFDCLVLLLLTRQLFQCAPSLPRVRSKSRFQSFREETCQGWSDNEWVENFRTSIGAYQRVNSCHAVAVVSVFIACSSKICRNL